MFIAFNYIRKFLVLTIAMVTFVQVSPFSRQKTWEKYGRPKYACAVFFKKIVKVF